MNYYITTLGCPKNEADSREIEKSLLFEGFQKSKNLEEANFHIINTCAFIEEAKKETIETILQAIEYKKKLKKRNKNQKVIVVGCFAERYHKEIDLEIPEVDFIFGTGIYHRAGELIRDKFQIPQKQNVDYYNILKSIISPNKFYEPVKVSDGCNRNCAFCAIPQFRGKFRYRDQDDIIKEIQELTNNGIKEICLVSQDTNSYGNNIEHLISLLEKIEEIDSLKWLRLLYLYPDKKTEKLIKEIAKRKLTKLVPYLESPVQHVSERILKKMNRSGDYEFFKNLFTMARELIPELEIRTTFLVGFPGEEYKDIELIKKFIEELKIEHISFFAYSPEEGTPAYNLKKSINKKDVNIIINELQNIYQEQLKFIMSKNINKTYCAILEKIKSNELHLRRPQSAPEIDDIVIIPYQPRQWKEKYHTLPKLGHFYDIEIVDFIAYDYIGRFKNIDLQEREK